MSPADPATAWTCPEPLGALLPILRASLGTATLPTEQDWEAVAEAARLFGAVPAVYHATQRTDLALPATLLELLQPDMRQITQTNLVLAMELVRLAARLKDHDVACLTFKGAANAMALYDDLSHRQCGDIDLIVPVEDFEKAERILLGAGFVFVRRYQNALQASFHHERTQATIDLHWGIPPRALELKPAPIWTCRERIKILSGEVDSLNLEGMLVMLAINCSKEPWDVSLRQAYDLAWLLTYPPRAIDWHLVLRVAQRSGARRLVNAGLSLAQIVFSLPRESVPPLLVRNFRDKKQVMAELLHTVQQVEVNTDVQMPSPIVFRRWTQYYDAVHPTELRRQRKMLQRLYTVTDADRQWLALPPGWEWLYPVLRPFRLIWQRLFWIGRRR